MKSFAGVALPHGLTNPSNDLMIFFIDMLKSCMRNTMVPGLGV